MNALNKCSYIAFFNEMIKDVEVKILNSAKLFVVTLNNVFPKSKHKFVEETFCISCKKRDFFSQWQALFSAVFDRLSQIRLSHLCDEQSLIKNPAFSPRLKLNHTSLRQCQNLYYQKRMPSCAFLHRSKCTITVK